MHLTASLSASLHTAALMVMCLGKVDMSTQFPIEQKIPRKALSILRFNTGFGVVVIYANKSVELVGTRPSWLRGTWIFYKTTLETFLTYR